MGPKTFFFITFLCFIITITEGKYGCKDMNGEDVDWFVALKAPIEGESDDPIFRYGYAYSYADEVNSLEWTGLGLNESKGAIYETLQQIYTIKKEVDDYAWFYYNDEDPSSTTHSSYGHFKGVASWNTDTGFWLIHSVPRWPNGSSTPYEFPSYEAKYGQSFLCVTYDYLMFNNIGENWMVDKPAVYDYNFPESMVGDLPNIENVVNHDFITTVDAAQYLTLTSNAGNSFLSFAKNAHWDKDLYESLVSPTLESDLYVESWMNGANPMPTYCRTLGGNYSYDVMNVRDVELEGVEWTETKDHSKWAVTTNINGNGKENWACIGDINRQMGQENRAGGTCCFLEKKLWEEMTGMIIAADQCSQ